MHPYTDKALMNASHTVHSPLDMDAYQSRMIYHAFLRCPQSETSPLRFQPSWFEGWKRYGDRKSNNTHGDTPARFGIWRNISKLSW